VQRVHVEHLVHAAHLLLDGRGHRLLERDRIGPRVARGQEDLGRSDVGIERNGQLDHGDEADDHHEDGDHHGDDRPVDEEPGHCETYFGALVSEGPLDSGRTFCPARTRSPPSTTTRSPGLSPSLMTHSEPTRAPTLTARMSIVSSAVTTATWCVPWTSCTAR